jgi:hypothetical protein
MRSTIHIWAPRAALVLLTLIAAYFLYPHLVSTLGAGLGAVSSALLLVAYIFAIIALPLMFFALLKFAYFVFARPYIRMRRIRRIRYARYMREAVKRGKFKVIVNPHRASSDQHPSPPEAER